MKLFKAIRWYIFAMFSLWMVWGCATKQPDKSVQRESATETTTGAKRIFTNAHVVMWVPLQIAKIWDGPTSGVYIGETTPPGAFVKEYRIELDIEIVDTPEQLQTMKRWSSSDWFYKEHPEVSIIDVEYGKQLRRDIWNPEKSRRLLISARVMKSATFEDDVDTAKKMIESIELINK